MIFSQVQVSLYLITKIIFFLILKAFFTIIL